MTAPFQQKKILLVEDSRDVREVLAHILEVELYQVYQRTTRTNNLTMSGSKNSPAFNCKYLMTSA